MITPSVQADYATTTRMLVTLTEADFSELVEVLKNADKYVHPEELAQAIGSKLPTLEANAPGLLVEFLVSMFLKVALDELPDGSVYNIHEVLSEEPNSYNVFVKRLVSLFNASESIQLRAKTIQVISAQERLLRESRIFTDVRPVFPSFEPDLEDESQVIGSPDGAVVLHTLRLRYYEDGSLSSFFVCLDDSDLEDLEMQIRRARLKAREMQNALKTAGIKLLSE